MRPYEFLPHTADVKFRAYGKTLEEAFQNSAYAMTDIITDHEQVKLTAEKTIHVESENKEALLYDFLEQFLILLDSEGFLLAKVKELEIEDDKLTAEVMGDVHPENYEIGTHIKAITYQEMFIEEERDGYVVQCIVDV